MLSLNLLEYSVSATVINSVLNLLFNMAFKQLSLQRLSAYAALFYS